MIRTLYNLYIEDITESQMLEFDNNSKAWYNYEQDTYSIDNPSERLELLLTLKGYEYDVDTTAKGWTSIVEQCTKEYDIDVKGIQVKITTS
jgi:hypothetical protein